MSATTGHVSTAGLATQSRWPPIVRFLFWSLVFGLAYTQAPLYFSNQNQYFLHGLARAGHGMLADDWLANTRDPTWFFSSIVALVAGWFDVRVFCLLHVLVLGAYIFSLLGIAGRLWPGPLHSPALLMFATILVVLHSGIVRWTSAQLMGVDYPWFLQAGVAGQYLLGFGLQPSVCGVFLLVSLYSFVADRPWQAAAWACLGATLHATYLLAAGLVVFGYLVVWLREGQVRRALLVGVFALVLVAPVVGYSLYNFRPSDPATFAEAQRILAHVRIPHHALPDRWFDAIAGGQVAWMLAAILLLWRTRLFAVAAIVFVSSLGLTIVQVVTDSDTLALLFPWRTSALLMPLATTILCARLVMTADAWLHRRERAVQVCCGIVLAACVAGGLAIHVFGLGYHTSTDELPLLDYVRAHGARGDVYLLPVEIPKTGSGPRGAASRNKNFTPAPRRGGGGPHISVDLQSFRLAAGAPIYVDFKSIPYQDREVLEWHRRLKLAHRLFEHSRWHDLDVIAELHAEGITHVVTPGTRPITSAGLQLVYEDAAYRLYRVVAPSK